MKPKKHFVKTALDNNIFWLTFIISFAFLALTNRYLMTQDFFPASNLNTWSKISTFRYSDQSILPTFFSQFPPLSNLLSLFFNLLPGQTTLLSIGAFTTILASLVAAIFSQYLRALGYQSYKILALGLLIVLNPFFLFSMNLGVEISYFIILMSAYYLGIIHIRQHHFARGFLLLSTSLAALYLIGLEGSAIAFTTFIFIPFILDREMFKESPLGTYVIAFFPLVATILTSYFFAETISGGSIIIKKALLLDSMSNHSAWKTLCEHSLFKALLIAFGGFTFIGLPLVSIKGIPSRTRLFLTLLNFIPFISLSLASWAKIVISPIPYIGASIALIPCSFFFKQMRSTKFLTKRSISAVAISLLGSWLCFSVIEPSTFKNIVQAKSFQTINQESIDVVNYLNANAQFKTLSLSNDISEIQSGISNFEVLNKLYLPSSQEFKNAIAKRNLSTQQVLLTKDSLVNLAKTFNQEDKGELWDTGLDGYQLVFANNKYKIYRLNSLPKSDDSTSSTPPKSTSLYQIWGGDSQWLKEIIRSLIIVLAFVIFTKAVSYHQRRVTNNKTTY